ncbi:MAG: guanine deaminase [Burkholderiales bacterium]|nr:guanine deaminase [Burkholderiales bacterium]
MIVDRRLLRGTLFDFVTEPSGGAGAVRLVQDGLLVIEAGRVVAHGEYDLLVPHWRDATATLDDHRGSLITPGFIDTHLHLPQIDVIASPAPGLLDWLERHTFPTEAGSADPARCAESAAFFLDELARQGTTSACVYGTVHPQSVQALFEAALARDVRLVAGKCLMDVNCPENLRDTAAGGVQDSADLAARWHGRGRLGYAITPRFAATSSRAQLAAAGELARAQPQLYVQSHVAENLDEVRWVAELFPEARSYLDVYERYGLLNRHSVYAHCIHFDAADRARMAAQGAVAAVCPTSNLFLGSGLFDFAAAAAAGMAVTLATDVGGGQSFSMFSAMRSAHEVARLRGQALDAFRLWYWATRGAALALGWPQVGTLEPGAEADVIVMNLRATPLLARRTARAGSLEELLFALLVLGDDRVIAQTYIAGQPMKPAAAPTPTATTTATS